MNQKKAKMLKKLAVNLGLPYEVVKKNYQGLNSVQRNELAAELKRIEKATYDKSKTDSAIA